VTVAGETADPGSLVVLFDGIATDNGNHDGGCLRIGPDGMLYVATGDTGRGDFGQPGEATNPYAQNLRRPEGKILRMTLAGAAAPGNPFGVEIGGAAPFVFAYGLRNPFRFAFQPATGLLWAGDVGQNTWEEIDVVPSGGNLGWPQCEGFEPVGTCPGASVPPVHVYRHGARRGSVTGGVFYTGTQFSSPFHGSYFFGDFVRDEIYWAVPRETNDGFRRTPDVFVTAADGPVDFTVGPDGGLYYVAFSAGEVRRVLQVGLATTPCTHAVAGGLRRWIADRLRAIDRCMRRDGQEECIPPPGPASTPVMTARLARRLARTCVPPPEDLCTALGCVPCTAARELAACVTAPAAAWVDEIEEAIYAAAVARRCGRALSRGLRRVATRMQRLIVRCERRTPGGACIPPDGMRLMHLRARMVRRADRACAEPPVGACATLGCPGTCATTADVWACVEDAAADRVVETAGDLYGDAAESPAAATLSRGTRGRRWLREPTLDRPAATP
jgi:hypothetical protein